MKPASYVPTRSIREAISGREIEILSSLGIRWNGSSAHIRCPYPDHDDKHLSWRWDQAKKRAHCTCASSTSILDVIAKVKGIDFEAAKIAAAEMIGRNDLIRHTGRKTYQRADAASLLNPASENRDDDLIRRYLGARLGVEPGRVLLPTTNLVGHRSLGYFDPPSAKGGKSVHVGDYPAAVFETVDRDGKRHAHRVYLAPGGTGKAELGLQADGQSRNPKKSATKKGRENTAGRAVIWGSPSSADIAIIFEGIETAAAAALAFATEIEGGTTMIAACITAGGIEAFKPWPSAKRVIVGADRDEAGVLPTKRGEIAALKFAKLHFRELSVAIALPGQSGEEADWLNILLREGVEAVRVGLIEAKAYTLTSEDSGKTQSTSDDAEIAKLAQLSPLHYDRERSAAAQRLRCRTETLDTLVKKARGETESTAGQGRPISLHEPKPWHEWVDGSVLLSGLVDTVRQYVIVSEDQAVAVSLWCVHSHAHDASDVSPKLMLKSPQKRSGKTRLAEVIQRLVPRPLLVSGIKPAALLRIIEMKAPTLLIDEIDTAMKNREMAEALRGIMNSGFNRGAAKFVMNVPTPGGGFEPREFSTWAPQLLAGIGDLPDTIRDRSIEIEMVRKLPREEVKRLRQRDGADLRELSSKSLSGNFRLDCRVF
jgi:hypothetical protein